MSLNITDRCLVFCFAIWCRWRTLRSNRCLTVVLCCSQSGCYRISTNNRGFPDLQQGLRTPQIVWFGNWPHLQNVRFIMMLEFQLWWVNNVAPIATRTYSPSLSLVVFACICQVGSYAVLNATSLSCVWYVFVFFWGGAASPMTWNDN